MKLIDFVNARFSIQKLIRQDLPLRQAYELMKLTDVINFHLEFYGNEIAKFDPEQEPEKLAELNSMEIESPLAEKLSISLDGDLRLSATDVKLLLPFIDFV